MPARTDSFDLARLRLSSGEGRRLELEVALDPLHLGGQTYAGDPPQVAVVLDVSRMTQGGYALRLRFTAGLQGPCMRCLGGAHPSYSIDVREVDQPATGEELASPYVTDEQLDLGAWAHDALALALPTQLLCRPDCAGLCPDCGADLNEAGPEHGHEREPDSRWAKLSELRFD
jgi:uncharacterized protein